MSRLDWLGVSLAAALPIASASATVAEASADAFVAPSSPLHLTRTLRRPLHDANEIVSVRRYEVTISKEDSGYRVDGRLLMVEVSAPPSLNTLAAIERNRPDTGLFPFRLDARGLIASAARPAETHSKAHAGEAARHLLAKSALAASEQQQAESLIGQVLSPDRLPGAQWPQDLFSPALGQRSHTRRVALPGGLHGSVTTTVGARKNGQSSVLERTVTTDSGGGRRVTRETYELTPGTADGGGIIIPPR